MPVPDEIVALVVRDAQGTAKDIAELLTEIGAEVWAARVHDPVVKARLEEIRNRLPTSGAASEATLGALKVRADGLASESTLAGVLAAVDQLEGFTDGLEALAQAIRDRLPASLTGAGNLKTAALEFAGGTLQNGAETAVADTAVQVIAASTSRKAVLVQNTGPANVRIGTSGVTLTTGFRLAAGELRVLTMPFCPQNAIYAIREGALDSTVFAAEVV